MFFDYGLGDAQYQYDRQEPPDPFEQEEPIEPEEIEENQ